jgi:ATP-dependent DNA helicase RecG
VTAQPEAAVGRRLRQLRDLPITKLDGIGPRKAVALAELDVENILDLLTTYPRRYIDRSRQADLSELAVGEEAVVLAEVRQVRARRTRRGRPIVELKVNDATGGMAVVFFNQPWRSKQLPVGAQALFFGKLDVYRGTRQMTNPVVDLLVGVDGADGPYRTGRLVPVYPASAKAGLSSWEIGGWVAEALGRAGQLSDPLPRHWREELGLVDRTTATRGIHEPVSLEEVEPARRRLAFDELLRLQLALVLRRRALERDARAIRHSVSPLELTPSGPRRQPTPTLVQEFVAGLPFELTRAQVRALAVIFADLAGPLPMHRLLQGDVGSGKTVVAVAGMLAAVQGGHQAALMVPTEVLADQHFAALRALVEGLRLVDATRLGGTRDVAVRLLTSKSKATDRARLLDGLASGSVDLLVGTHALLTDQVSFRSLGLVVIDEQHRFGVEQRAALREKGRDADTADVADPDLLVMTATPIPRTAAMVVFGDLDMTVLDEVPPGRSPVRTTWTRTREEEASAWDRVRDEAGAGRRVFVVCPLVEGSDRVVARSAVEELERLRARLPGLRLGLLHGQMPSPEKEAAMAAFRSGEVQVLVATTVVEVGVDVPEATVMVILDAERFGMAQLHQLRGRVGRGSLPSWCFLLGRATTPGSVERLEAMEKTTDGFELAEVDLRLRGEGTILGARQKGRSDLKLASLTGDRALLDDARDVAESITRDDPTLASHPLMEDEVRLFLTEDEAAFLFRS